MIPVTKIAAPVPKVINEVDEVECHRAGSISVMRSQLQWSVNGTNIGGFVSEANGVVTTTRTEEVGVGNTCKLQLASQPQHQGVGNAVITSTTNDGAARHILGRS